MTSTAQSSRRWWWVSMLLVGMGLSGSAYLLARVFALLSAGTHPVDLCSALFAMSCDGALADERLWI
jgi:hypothetical protein